jgi:hypothetical protein
MNLYNFFNNISQHGKSKIIRFVNYDKYKDIENWLKKQFVLYSPFRTSKYLQLGINVT